MQMYPKDGTYTELLRTIVNTLRDDKDVRKAVRSRQLDIISAMKDDDRAWGSNAEFDIMVTAEIIAWSHFMTDLSRATLIELTP